VVIRLNKTLLLSSQTELPAAKLFEALQFWLHRLHKKKTNAKKRNNKKRKNVLSASCDLHVLSALTTFDAIRDIEFDTTEVTLSPSILMNLQQKIIDL